MAERPILFSAPMVRALLAGTKTQTRRAIAKQATPDLYYQRMWGTSPPPNPVDFGTPGLWRIVGPDYPDSKEDDVPCPYGLPGDRLWVREAFMQEPADYCWEASVSIPSRPAGTVYRADLPQSGPGEGWTPSIHMPRKLSRIDLEITGVRVERLQGISEADAIAEGISELVPASKRTEGLTPAALAFAAAATVDSMPRTTRRGFLAGALAATLGFAASPSRPWEVAPGRMTRAPSARELYAVLWETINGPGTWAANPWVWVVEFRRVEAC